MNVHLDREDISNLLMGCDPSYEMMDHPIVDRNGRYTGGHVDQWNWNYRAFIDDRATDEELYNLYKILKHS